MEAFMESRTDGAAVSKGALWTSYILEALILLLLTFDWATKVLRVKAFVAQAAQMGFSENTIFTVGVILLVCCILYVIPRTKVLGAILLTGYLGGAIETNWHVGQPLGLILFPGIFGVLVWVPLYLRDRRIRDLIPMRS
jgi:DoxX-like family